MNQAEYLEFHKQCTEKMYEITKNKNTDYCKSTADAFSNFSAVSALGIASVEQGFLTRIMDKICRINSFVQKGFLNVKDESVEDTLLDLANYCLLFIGYLKSKKRADKPIVSGRPHHCYICNKAIERRVFENHFLYVETVIGESDGKISHERCHLKKIAEDEANQ